MPQPDINTGTPLSTSLNGLFSQMQQNDQQSKEQMKPVLARQEAISDKEASMKPPDMPAAPKTQDYTTSPIDAFGSGASWLATFGSLLTRKHLTNALNSGASVMNAYHAKDQANFKSAYDTWKQNVANAKDKWQEEQDWIKGQGGLNKDNASMIAAATKNDTLASMAQARMLDNYMKDGERHGKALSATTAKMDELDYRMQADKAKIEEAGGQWTPELEQQSHMQHYGEIFNTSQATKQKQDEALANFDYKTAKMDTPVPGTGLTMGVVKQYGDAIHSGAKPGQLGLGYSVGPVKKAVENYVASTYPNFDMAKAQMDYSAASAAEKSLDVQTKKIELASNILDESIPSLVNIAEKYMLSDSTDLNKMYNFIQSHASDTDKADFSTQLRAVTTDYAQFIGRGRQTVHSDEEALKILHDDMGVDSLKGFQRAVNTEQKNVQRGIAKTKNGSDDTKVGMEKPSVSHPLPKELSADPDGTRVPDKTGKMWIKQGDKLIPE